jgi:hypothetical protein
MTQAWPTGCAVLFLPAEKRALGLSAKRKPHPGGAKAGMGQSNGSKQAWNQRTWCQNYVSNCLEQFRTV